MDPLTNQSLKQPEAGVVTGGAFTDIEEAGVAPITRDIDVSLPTVSTGFMTLVSEFDKVFESKGNIKVGTSNDIFSNLGYTLPFSGSGVNTYITSLVSKQFIKGFEPTYLQIPYIYSGADNLINGNYKSFEVKDGNKIITTYYIPYQGLNGKEEIATIVTYYDIITNILFYEVPSEFSYNSLTKLSVAASQISEKEYSFKVLIPEDWISPLLGNTTALGDSFRPTVVTALANQFGAVDLFQQRGLVLLQIFELNGSLNLNKINN